MNVNPILIAMRSTVNLPVYAAVSSQNMPIGAEYVTFSYVVDDEPTEYAGDEDIAGVTTVQIHAFTHTTDPRTLRRKIKNYLRNNDFVISAGDREISEQQTGAIHSVVEAQIYGEITKEDI